MIVTVRLYTRMNPATRAQATSTGKWLVLSVLTVVGIIFETLETRRPGVGFLMVLSGIGLARLIYLRRRTDTNSDVSAKLCVKLLHGIVPCESAVSA